MTPQDLGLDRLFHALADTSRRGMIDRLSRGPASASELAQPLTMALPSVVKHLQVLEAGGVVTSLKAGRVRTYNLAPAALAQVEAWVAARKAGYEAQFDRLEAYLVAQGDGA
ncbi:MAG: metalloregulator ArsR/SmtB family transcription factor [Alphaproteobacteria bacterium]|nr:metalloregulator ArsR/SmtB family transcription factor [Alphaproteobacteria bacterium]MBU1512779.1 metalloregulator ArsR/SmtB family transcription factor [Alphaproteobacteria bacterium]MBU2096564.1 metalloregulator ArsR/SmtB family transcription factor [Alphaproteobacteria bacterium]MBU2151932.1 metalloregulator ArsR/SmtB family transcription factor [Alphaproteobacteria bacterium]MBU2306442.1 metalloregulator ArsR/SmtB family transcription factor [Alphaproteobacteria bacterium]